MSLKIKILVKFFAVAILMGILSANAQKVVNPIHQNIKIDDEGKMYFELNNKKHFERKVSNTNMVLDSLIGNPQGTNNGIFLDFNNTNFVGKLYFGLIPYEEAKHPQPVFRTSVPVNQGRVAINIMYYLRGTYDMIKWEEKGKGALGYRLVSASGRILYDGIVGFTYDGKTFKIDDTVIEGPFVNILTHESTTISFVTNKKIKASVEIEDQQFSDKRATTNHEIEITGLLPSTKYSYTIVYGNNRLTYSFTTAPKSGTRSKFMFAYASDSRGGIGGGERNIKGSNSYILKKLLGLAYYKKAVFAQFTGDMISGYTNLPGTIDLEYANWKRTAGLYGAYIPIYCTMGNHEIVMTTFIDTLTGKLYSVDKFPYKENSAETIFNRNFTNPLNGPESEDGAWYDPDFKHDNFPSYKENVYHYTYDNVVVIVLNSDYLHAPSLKYTPAVGGNLHGYILDNQMKWLEETLNKFENDSNIDHIFVTQHTPAFPNGGHVGDDMWYRGNNLHRPVIGKTAHKVGIVERRDEYLDLLINKSSKVAAILTGDEHNYNRLRLDNKTPIYKEDYQGKKLELSRKIYQINNGAAGAPYYAQDKTPWSSCVERFSTLNAVVFFEIDGKKINVKVMNPDTFELVDEFTLR